MTTQQHTPVPTTSASSKLLLLQQTDTSHRSIGFQEHVQRITPDDHSPYLLWVRDFLVPGNMMHISRLAQNCPYHLQHSGAVLCHYLFLFTDEPVFDRNASHCDLLSGTELDLSHLRYMGREMGSLASPWRHFWS